jgi:hypothetical protein
MAVSFDYGCTVSQELDFGTVLKALGLEHTAENIDRAIEEVEWDYLDDAVYGFIVEWLEDHSIGEDF